MARSLAHRSRSALLFEFLEDRTAPATFTVSIPGDDGAGSLRQAIRDANTNPGTDAIVFAVAGAEAIRPATPLDAVTDAVTLDATTQPGFAGTPVVVLDGSLLKTGDGLTLSAHTGSTVRGLAVVNFPGVGVRVTGGGGHALRGNYVGIAADGVTAAPNGGGGVAITAGAGPATTVGGKDPADRNVISGNAGPGIAVLPTAGGRRPSPP